MAVASKNDSILWVLAIGAGAYFFWPQISAMFSSTAAAPASSGGGGATPSSSTAAPSLPFIPSSGSVTPTAPANNTPANLLPAAQSVTAAPAPAPTAQPAPYTPGVATFKQPIALFRPLSPPIPPAGVIQPTNAGLKNLFGGTGLVPPGARQTANPAPEPPTAPTLVKRPRG